MPSSEEMRAGDAGRVGRTRSGSPRTGPLLPRRFSHGPLGHPIEPLSHERRFGRRKDASNAAAYGAHTMAHHRAAIDAARAAGVRRIVYTSHQAAAAGSEFFPSRDHAATEALLRASGLAWTSLRNGFYASSGIDYLIGREFLETGILEAPAEGKTAWTDRADLAAAAAAVLLDEGRYDGPTPPLTGSQSLDFADVAKIASEVLGRAITRKVLSDDDYRAKVAAKRAPPQMAEFSLSFYRAARGGEFAAVDPALEQLIGRPPTTMRELIARAVAG